jgi:hypothetical protein
MFAAALDDRVGWFLVFLINKLFCLQEFRHLTEHHTNHEDKLQIKSIVYHSVKVSCYFVVPKDWVT